MYRFARFPTLAFAMVTLAGVMLTPAAPFFAATSVETGAVLFCQPLPGHRRIALVFTHSMYGGDVREEYVIGGDGRLRRVEMTTANAAAAEYYAYDGAVARAGDRFRVEAPPASFDGIVVRVDRIGRQWLTWDGGAFDLLAAAGDGVPVRLSGERRTLLDRVLDRGC